MLPPLPPESPHFTLIKAIIPTSQSTPNEISPLVVPETLQSTLKNFIPCSSKKLQRHRNVIKVLQMLTARLLYFSALANKHLSRPSSSTLHVLLRNLLR